MVFTNPKTGERVPVEFRPFAPGDEEGFRACIEDYYGGGYPYPEYFAPGFLAGKCAAGDMLVLCGARPDTGEIVNTCAIRLDGEFPGTGLMLLRVVKPACQGLGIGREQERMQLEYAKPLPRRLALRRRHDPGLRQPARPGDERLRRSPACAPGSTTRRRCCPALSGGPARGSARRSCAAAGPSPTPASSSAPREHRAAAGRVYAALGAAAYASPTPSPAPSAPRAGSQRSTTRATAAASSSSAPRARTSPGGSPPCPRTTPRRSAI